MAEMKYRAILIDPGNSAQDRPLQTFSNDRNVINEWAEKVLRNAVSEQAYVDIFQNLEQRIESKFKPKKATP